MKTGFTSFIFMLIIVSGLASCKKNHYKVNISSITVKIEIKRLEKDLFTLNPDEIISTVLLLRQKYNGFLSYSAT